MTRPVLLRGVDLAAFAAALTHRLRNAGVVVSASGPGSFVAAMRELVPSVRSQLYWTGRLTLVNRAEDLPAYDAVFEAVFADAILETDPVARAALKGPSASAVPATGERNDNGPEAGGLPWATRPPSIRAGSDDDDDSSAIPDMLPSRIVARADESIRASRSTGWEPVHLARTRPRRQRRRVVLVCDISQSMRPYAAIYLHLMRAAALRSAGFRPEVFVFSTTLTRLTPVLAHRSPEVALARANEKVVDRYGGTHLGRAVTGLLAPPHGAALRGAVVVIASDGWDSDPPELLDHALARLKRRAAHLIWLNPRAAAPGFAPLAGSMAAALPYCDVFMPAHSLQGVRELFGAIAALS